MSHTTEQDHETLDGTDPPIDEEPVPRDERRLRILAGVHEGTVCEASDLLPRGTSPSEVETELREIHLPKLDSAGYIDWNPETGRIKKGPRFEELELEMEWSTTTPDEFE